MRWTNLSLMAFFIISFHFVAFPKFIEHSFFTDFDFFLLAFSFILSTGTGYFINDFYDQQIDQINKQKNFIFGMQKRVVWLYWFFLNSISILLVSWVLHKQNHLELILVYFFALWLLWLYSARLKRCFFWGNFTVSFLIAFMIIFLIPFYDIYFQNKLQSVILPYLFWLSSLAFLLNLAREIIKDYEDIEGDQKEKARTIPIILGKKKSKGIILGILILCILINIIYFVSKDQWLNALLFSLIISLNFPFLYKLSDTKGAKKLSLTLKISMFMGIVSGIFFISN
ncbi:MAG: UbiA family prenyltransferase [Flavobacteriales bacterium]|jgi:4-hydroxybenzoate polyprenyltransferase|nr:UbiA family prenyltransferase [Flavobacteriales bacterium]